MFKEFHSPLNNISDASIFQGLQGPARGMRIAKSIADITTPILQASREVNLMKKYRPLDIVERSKELNLPISLSVYGSRKEHIQSQLVT